MKIKSIFVLISLFVSLHGFAQKKLGQDKKAPQEKHDTIYYDKNWNTSNKQVAFYYGIIDIDKYYIGSEFYYYITGEKHSVKSIVNGSQHGRATWWFKNGQKWCEGYFKNGRKEGVWTNWYANGQKESEGTYIDKQEKDFKFWDELGNRIYTYNELTAKPLFGDQRLASKSERKFNEYVFNHTQYPKVGKEKKIEGPVLVSFVIDTAGTINDVKVIEGINYYLDDEAVKIIKESPSWKPGKIDGIPVRTRFKVLIDFHL